MTLEQIKALLVADGYAVVPTDYLQDVTAEAIIQHRDFAYWKHDPETFQDFYLNQVKASLGIEGVENAAVEAFYDNYTGALHFRTGTAMFVPTSIAPQVPHEGPNSPMPIPGSKPTRITSKRGQ